jgi:hypothetical protein
MKYPDGTSVRLGDRVRLLNGQLGQVVVSVDTDEYAEDFPASDWADHLAEGVLIRADNGALISIGTNEDQDVRPA